jgi:hypothetical protein
MWTACSVRVQRTAYNMQGKLKRFVREKWPAMHRSATLRQCSAQQCAPAVPTVFPDRLCNAVAAAVTHGLSCRAIAQSSV